MAKTRGDTGAKLLKRTLGDELATVNDRDVRTKPLDDLEHVRSKEDRSATRDHPLQHRLQGAGGNSVDAFERLVEKKNLGSVNDRGSKSKFLLHAMREVSDELFRSPASCMNSSNS